jgi:hypothetical protein
VWRLRPWRRATVAVAAASGLALLVPVAVWLGIARALDRAAVNKVPGTGGGAAAVGGPPPVNLFDYLWQFYLPKLPFQTRFPNAEELPLYEIFVKQAWGAFGWLEVMYAEPVYAVLTALTAVVLVAAGVALWRTRRSVDLAIAAFFVLVAVTLLAGLHWTEYHYVLGGNVNFMQGRYLFPLIGLGALILAKALTLVPTGWRATVVAAGIGLLVVLQLYGLGLALQRYYA